MARSTRFALALLVLACGRDDGGKSLPTRPLEVRAATTEEDPDDAVQVRPVYDDAVAEDPRARALCEALYVVPSRRRGECCADGLTRQAQELADRCAQVVSAAVAGGGVALDDAGVERCVAALAESHAGCEWVGPWTPELPAACAGYVRGGLAAEARCRSNLECAPGLRCAGVGPTDAGVCAAPAGEGAVCDTAVDTLATYLRADLAEHPGCAGRCVKHRCREVVAEGGACQSQSECATGLHCDGTACRAGASADVGAPCADGGCASGSRCVKNRCVAAGPSGAACETDVECRGACLRGADGARACGPRCGPPDLGAIGR